MIKRGTKELNGAANNLFAQKGRIEIEDDVSDPSSCLCLKIIRSSCRQWFKMSACFLCSSFSKVGVAMSGYFHHNAKSSDVKANQLQC